MVEHGVVAGGCGTRSSGAGDGGTADSGRGRWHGAVA